MRTETARRVRVLIVDDSALVRRVLTDLLAAEPQFEVVGTACDAFDARDKIKALNPDVLTLDVEMPRMDGIAFLRNLMRLRPMPVVMISSLTERGAGVTLDALRIGAVDFLTKPKIDIAAGLLEYREELVAKLGAAARARVRGETPTGAGLHAVIDKRPPTLAQSSARVIAIGASTGGTEAIRAVLEGFDADTPGILIAQHIPKAFSASFAARLDRECRMSVAEAVDGQPVLTGHVYVAPGDRHLLLERQGPRFVCRIDDSDPVGRYKPAIDLLFSSVARAAGRHGIGVILTGMGKDGAAGLAEMRECGAQTIAQDQATSLVWGMPGEAVGRGAAGEVLALDDIPQAVLRCCAGQHGACVSS